MLLDKNIFTQLKQESFWKLIKKTADNFKSAKIYLVGGAVRDLLIGRETKDWDLVVAGAEIEKLQKFLSTLGDVNLVGDHFGVLKFTSEKLKIDEALDIALPRKDHAYGTGGYKDFEVQSDQNLPIEDDLGRRDFTINALALDLNSGEIIDPYHGVEDLKHKIIKTVGVPADRFGEDYTRLLRAVRFACQLHFALDKTVLGALAQHAAGLKKVAPERIHDELVKIVMSDRAEQGIVVLQETGLLEFIIPELENGVGVEQNQNHIFTVFEHLHRALGFAVERDYSLEVRLAALLHDIAKPHTKRGFGRTSTFYNHDIVGAKFVRKILTRLKFSTEMVERISHLVRHHMFYYSLGEVSDAGVRRLLVRVGKDYLGPLIQLRICDRLGMGRPKAKPFKLLELEKRFQEVQMDPISAKMLKLDGNDVITILKMKPGPRIGLLLGALLEEVLPDPARNEREYLIGRLKDLDKMSDEELRAKQPNIDQYEEKRKAEFFQEYREVE